MVNAVKESIQIKINNPFPALYDLALRLIYRLVRIAIRPESVAMGVKVRFPDRGEHLRYRLLDNSVYDRGYTQLALATIGFGYFNPFDGLWSVVTIQELAFDLGPVVCQVIRQFFYRHAINSGGTFVTFDLFQRAHQIRSVQYLRQ